MSRTTFSGPVKSDDGFEGNLTGAVTGDVTGSLTGANVIQLTLTEVAALPDATPDTTGTIYFVTGASSGNTLVFSTGTVNIDALTGTAVTPA